MSPRVGSTLRPCCGEAPRSHTSGMLGAGRQKDLVSKSPFGEKLLPHQPQLSGIKGLSARNELLPQLVHGTFGGGC